jgi:transcription elongation factor Elf1
MTVSRKPSNRDVPPKTTLFCPNCDHQDRMDGDWHVVRKNHTAHYICPDCETEIAVHPIATQES